MGEYIKALELEALNNMPLATIDSLYGGRNSRIIIEDGKITQVVEE